MSLSARIPKFIAILLALLWVGVLSGCREAPVSSEHFVGKWKSTKLETPIYLHANGEWEIKTDAGDILQYGIWHYDGKLVWSYKVSGSIGHDENAILSVARDEFKLREADGSITVFTRLKTPEGKQE